MYLFFEQGIRGGYSNIHKNYSKANHKYLVDYDENMESIFLWYGDVNSLYPTVMIEAMPVRDFSWASQEETDKIFKLCKSEKHNEIPPCTLSVDLKHSPKNFDREKIFTMCPDFYEEDGVKKLTHNLFDKKDYVVHYRTLQKYLSEGMILEKVNKVIFYMEKAWMKDDINFCVEQRKLAELAGNNFSLDFRKLMMNSVFGKTMENIRNGVNFKIINNEIKLQKKLNKPTLQDVITYHNNLLVGVHLTKQKITLNKPIYTGQCILDNSKRHMYEFVYDYCFPKWGVDNFRVCRTDTDSIIAEIKTCTKILPPMFRRDLIPANTSGQIS